MNVRTEQLEALLKQQEFQAKKNTSEVDNDSFATTLADEQAALGNAGNSTEQSAIPTSIQATLAQQVWLSEAGELGNMNGEVQEAFNNVSGALDKLNSYAEMLHTSRDGGNLRDAYSLLEGIDGQVASLKSEQGSVLEQNPELASLVDELEILSVTERFKFNRGDYI